MRSVEDPQLNAMVKELTRARTVGNAKPAQDASAADGAAAATAERPQTAEPSKVDIVFSSTTSRISDVRPVTPSALTTQAALVGRPTSSCGVRPSSAAKQSVRPATAQATSHTTRGRKLAAPPRATGMEKETFLSKVPLKYCVAGTGPVASTYSDAFGSLAGGMARRPRSALTGPVRIREVTCPIGAVNPHTALAPFRHKYPVPECYTLVRVGTLFERACA